MIGGVASAFMCIVIYVPEACLEKLEPICFLTMIQPPVSYNIKQILIDNSADPNKVSKVLVHGFITGLASSKPQVK